MPIPASPNEIPKFFSIDKFDGLNQHDSRSAIGDQECSWLQNYIPLGSGNCRTLWAEGDALYTATGSLTISYVFHFNIASNFYHAVFLSDGSAVQVASDGTTTTIGTASTFSTGVCCAQWGASGILIVDSASYFAWDGTLYSSGDASPNWLNGGTATNMPSGISGSCIEVFEGRVWVGDGAEVSFSAPNNGADFSTSSGGGTITSTDSFLKEKFVNLKQSNGFLYLFGDSSVNVVSNVQTSGSPATTTFNNANVDPQVGIAWRDTLQAFGRALVFANPSGVYALYGGAAEKISDKLDQLFANATFSDPTPTSFVTVIYGVKCYGLLFKTISPFTGETINIIAAWDGHKWFLASQIASITQISGQEKDATLMAWGNDGTKLYPLFSTRSDTLEKKLQTKLWAGTSPIIFKQTLRAYVQAFDNSGSGFSLSGTCDSDVGTQNINLSSLGAVKWVNKSLAAVTWENDSDVTVGWSGAGLGISGIDLAQAGKLLGFTITSKSKDFTMVSLGMAYNDRTFYG